MAFAYALDPAVPAGGEAAALGDDRIREFKNAIIERVNSRFVSIEADPWVIKSPAVGGNTQSLVPTADNTYAVGTAALRMANSYFVALSVGTGTYAAVGQIRFPNDNVISWRNAGNTADFTFRLNTANNFYADTNLAIPTTRLLYFDGGSNTYITEDVADELAFVMGGVNRARFRGSGAGVQVIFVGSVQIPATEKYFVDGGGDTYIYESAANEVSVVVGGVLKTVTRASGFDVGTGRISIEPTQRIYLDGVGDTYITETSANAVELFTGGTSATLWQTTYVEIRSTRDLIIAATKRLYLDGGGDTYLIEESANTVSLVMGGGNGSLTFMSTATFTQMTMNNPSVGSRGSGIVFKQVAENVGYVGTTGGWLGTTDSHMAVSAYNGNTLNFYTDGSGTLKMQLDIAGNLITTSLQRHYFDSGGDTYILESAANVLAFVTGGITGANVISTGLAIPSGNKIWLDNGGDTYLYEAAANIWNIYAGGIFSLGGDATGVWVGATKKVYLDGGGDTYLYESAGNQVDLIAGGSLAMRFTGSAVVIEATDRFYFDGGVDTYLYEVAGNLLEFRVGANLPMRIGSTYAWLNTGYQFYLDGGGDSYLYESSANNIDIVCGGTVMARAGSPTATATGFMIQNATSAPGLVRLKVGPDLDSLGNPLVTVV